MQLLQSYGLEINQKGFNKILFYFYILLHNYQNTLPILQ